MYLIYSYISVAFILEQILSMLSCDVKLIFLSCRILILYLCCTMLTYQISYQLSGLLERPMDVFKSIEILLFYKPLYVTCYKLSILQ